ncbi:MAG: hypothetical protein U0841_04950 [Chloroflexia bacterium]
MDDPKDTPKEVRDLVKEMDKALGDIRQERGITLEEAANRIDAVIAQFQALAASLDDKRANDTAEKGGTPTVTSTPGGTVTPTGTPTTPTPGATSVPATVVPAGTTPTPSAPPVSPTATPASAPHCLPLNQPLARDAIVVFLR